MTIRNSMTALVVSAATIGAGVIAAGPAEAGGIIGARSPAFHNACANERTAARITGHTAHGLGAVGDSSAAMPIVKARQRCGGADIPLPDKHYFVTGGRVIKPCLLVTSGQCTTREIGSLTGGLF